MVRPFTRRRWFHRPASRSRPHSRYMVPPVALATVLLGLIAAAGCDDGRITAQEAVDGAVTWIQAESSEASGPTHRWVIANTGNTGRHFQGSNPGLDSALGPFLVDDEVYYFSFADTPGEQWYEMRAADINEIWTAEEFTQEQKEGLATLLTAMRLANPERLLSYWKGDELTLDESEEFDDAWRITGRLDSLEAAEEGLDQPIIDSLGRSDLFPGDMDVELHVAKEDGRPLEASFDPENQRPFSFTFSRTDETPEVPEGTIGVRQLLLEGPVGSPAPDSQP